MVEVVESLYILQFVVFVGLWQLEINFGLIFFECGVRCLILMNYVYMLYEEICLIFGLMCGVVWWMWEMWLGMIGCLWILFMYLLGNLVVLCVLSWFLDDWFDILVSYDVCNMVYVIEVVQDGIVDIGFVLLNIGLEQVNL